MGYLDNPVYGAGQIGNSIARLAQTMWPGPDMNEPLMAAQMRNQMAAEEERRGREQRASAEAQARQRLAGIFGGAGEWQAGRPDSGSLAAAAASAIEGGYAPNQLADMVRFLVPNLGGGNDDVYRAAVGAGAMPNADTTFTPQAQEARRGQLRQNAIDLERVRQGGQIAQEAAKPLSLDQTIAKVVGDMIGRGQVTPDNILAGAGMLDKPKMGHMVMPDGTTARVDQNNPNAPVLPYAARVGPTGEPAAVNAAPGAGAADPTAIRTLQITADGLGIPVEALMELNTINDTIRAAGTLSNPPPALIQRRDAILARIGGRQVAAPPPGSVPVR